MHGKIRGVTLSIAIAMIGSLSIGLSLAEDRTESPRDLFSILRDSAVTLSAAEQPITEAPSHQVALVRTPSAEDTIQPLAGLTPGSQAAPQSAAGQVSQKNLPRPSRDYLRRDSLLNRDGEHPQRERDLPLKRIADPANLSPEKPEAIQAAAAVKTDADLKQQKIKAIKYLATIGCGCPNYKEDVVTGLLSALEDCSEEVRYEAAKAFCKTSGNPCLACGSGNCCDPDAMKKLREMATGVDDQGCYFESSPRVRAAAQLAVNACSRFAEEPQPTPAPKGPVEKLTRYELEHAVDNTMSAPADNDLATDLGLVMLESQDSFSSVGYTEDIEDPESQFDFPRVREGGGIYGVSMTQPNQPLTGGPNQPLTAGPNQPLTASLDTSLFGFNTDAFVDAQLASAHDIVAPSAEGINAGGKGMATAPTTTGAALAESSTVQTTKVRRRSQVSLEPYIRGYRAGQIYTTANGAYWTPVRQDMDTMLSSIDPSMIDSVAIIPGPYGLRYGPGMAFIDVVRTPTPRYACGPESHYDLIGTTRGNGGQLYGRATASGGGSDWGYRFSYGHRKGSDYRAGNGLDIPSSYNNQDLLGEIGYDLSKHQRLELSYQRLDQTDTEFPGQFFDINALSTYGFNLRYIDDCPTHPWEKFEISSWYNQTKFNGDNSRKYDRDYSSGFATIQRANYLLTQEIHPGSTTIENEIKGSAIGNLASSGVRTETTFGDPEERELRVGADFRYLANTLREDYHVTGDISTVPDLDDFQKVMPHSWMSDPGMFVESSTTISERLKSSAGVRVDWVSTRTRVSDLYDLRSTALGDVNDPTLWEASDTLYAFYQTNDFKLSDSATLRAGFGYAQRPPTLMERYSDGLFVSLAQSGYTRVVGDPQLAPERNWQIDIGLDIDRPDWRAGAKFYHAWIQDYVTVEDSVVSQMNSARLLRYINTDLATLTGFEAAAEFDLYPCLSVFGVMSYVEGRDCEIDRFLWSIPPLESTVGLRLHDSQGGRLWSIELGSRIVADMNRLGVIRGDQGLIDDFETRTGGFTVCHIRGYWNRTENLRFIGGVDNLFDRNYIEHLDLRLSGPTGQFPNDTLVLSPGITPYVGVDWAF